MSVPLDRDFIAKGVIAAALCIGAWLMFVQPRMRELAVLEQTIAEHAAKPTPISQQTIELAAARVGEIRSRVREIEAQNALASDTSHLFSIIMDLASQYQLSVQGIQPTMASQKTTDREYKATRVDVVLEGEYEGIARFVEAVPQLHAFVRPATLTLTPLQRPNESRAHARFGFDVFHFTIADALAGLQGASNVQP